MSEQFTMEIADVEGVIENEIKQGLTQKKIAQTYALALRSSWPTDWAKVNKMIIDRWSVSGLKRIKKMAWSGSCFPNYLIIAPPKNRVGRKHASYNEMATPKRGTVIRSNEDKEHERTNR